MVNNRQYKDWLVWEHTIRGRKYLVRPFSIAWWIETILAGTLGFLMFYIPVVLFLLAL